ncbi:MAG: NADH-quinone oxidoreductase subunit NuoB [candidate division FCPU426 bacterium]
MFKALLARLKTGHRTQPFPPGAGAFSDRFRGRPEIKSGAAAADFSSCPTAAWQLQDGAPNLDLGRCLFCGDCPWAAKDGPLVFSRDYRLAASNRRDLLVRPGADLKLASSLGNKLHRLLGRALRLRQVSAGGCNACETDANVLTTVGFDLGRFGIQFVASPRHADGLIVTGPVTRNMRLALEKTYAAIPEPKIVIASGACAVSGGPYAGSEQVLAGVDKILPVDLYVPGCPPHPLTLLDGLLRILGRLPQAGRLADF